ncbi:MAG: cytochrome c [Acidobacteriaceae bacterium]|nr:cytochrome c [Acidobacteriaceae bacterium]
MRAFLFGFILGLIVLPAWGWMYFRYGYAPVATASSPMPFEKRLAHMALNARIGKEAPKSSPLPATDANYEAGVHVYREHCALCHGLPGQPQTPTSKGMYPQPPELFKGHGVTDDAVGETYWKVANGIRLTGMPAYTKSLSEDQMWQVSLMLANADKLSQQIRTELQAPLKTD